MDHNKYKALTGTELKRSIKYYQELQIELLKLDLSMSGNIFQNEKVCVYINVLIDSVIIYFKNEQCIPTSEEFLKTYHTKKMLECLYVMESCSKFITLDEIIKKVNAGKFYTKQ